jgi:hypothetical protein
VEGLEGELAPDHSFLVLYTLSLSLSLLAEKKKKKKEGETLMCFALFRLDFFLPSIMATSAAGGVGFGAGSAVGSGIINSIF